MYTLCRKWKEMDSVGVDENVKIRLWLDLLRCRHSRSGRFGILRRLR